MWERLVRNEVHHHVQGFRPDVPLDQEGGHSSRAYVGKGREPNDNGDESSSRSRTRHRALYRRYGLIEGTREQGVNRIRSLVELGLLASAILQICTMPCAGCSAATARWITKLLTMLAGRLYPADCCGAGPFSAARPANVGEGAQGSRHGTHEGWGSIGCGCGVFGVLWHRQWLAPGRAQWQDPCRLRDAAGQRLLRPATPCMLLFGNNPDRSARSMLHMRTVGLRLKRSTGGSSRQYSHSLWQTQHRQHDQGDGSVQMAARASHTLAVAECVETDGHYTVYSASSRNSSNRVFFSTLKSTLHPGLPFFGKW